MQPFSVPDAEVSLRLVETQRLMEDEGLAALVCFGAHRDYAPADLWYLARWSCIDEETSYVFVPASGQSTLITDAEWDLERARQEAFAGEVVLDRNPAVTITRLAREHCDSGDRLGISGLGTMPAPVYRDLALELTDLRLEDAIGLTTRQRMVKSTFELAVMREASRISDLGMAAGVEAMVEGASEHEIVAAAEYAMRREGAEISFTTVMGSGPRTALATFLPTDRRLERGDLVVLDCGARVSGYHGDMCRSIVVGPAGGEARRMLETASAAIRSGIEAARPGGRVRDIHEAARRVVVEAGLEEAWWGYYMPHGAGAGQHEPPLGLADGDVELRSGMVLCVEPGLAVPGVGGVILEQMIAVTDRGADVLNELPLELWET